MDLDEIELKYNLDFEPDIKKQYANIILDIFNNMCPDNYYNIFDTNNINIDVMMIVALYYISKENHDIALKILIDAHMKDINNYNITCTLGILYNILNDKTNSIYYFKIGADNHHILSATNLAYEYLCQGDFNNFNLYNKIGIDKNDENALINIGIYEWNILKNHKLGEVIFNDLFIKNNYRAYYEYAKLISDINIKKELLLKAIKLKPKKTYLEMLKKITGEYERIILFKKYNINNFNNILDYSNAFKYLENDLSRFTRCPICITINNEKKELFKLKCNHSFCNNCIIKYCQNKCCICYS
jgi:hypothetical protein